jgi:tetratricopeptide (TPR) repeat protein
LVHWQVSSNVTKYSSHPQLNIAFKRDCSALYAANGDAVLAASGDAALAASDYSKAIELYSAAIDLDSATSEILAKRCKARLEKALWADALLDAEQVRWELLSCTQPHTDYTQVIEFNPFSYFGYQLKYAALRGAHQYDEAIEVFNSMLSKLENIHDTETTSTLQIAHSPTSLTLCPDLRQKFFEVEGAIQKTINAQLDIAPHRLLNTFTGRLCDRKVQIDTFKTSTEYKELLSSILVHMDLEMERIEVVVATYFRYVMLSHRWEVREPSLHDIQDKVVYDLEPIGGIVKLQSFCKTARDMGYLWTWIDTCCIDRTNNVEVQQSVNSMFIWYHHSALTIIYLSDVPPLSQRGALASSVWNTRGWTVQEFLAPNIVLFYQKDWTVYLGDHSPNHKKSIAIMQEMEHATGIGVQALVAFRPGMRDAREKLQWASTRRTTRQEDIAYSLFGIFGVKLPVIYGEKKQRALGRLLQEVIARSGDITALDWVGQSSDFNSCLPADVVWYSAPSCRLPLSEDEIQTSISSLRHVVAVDLALKLYALLDNLNAPRFANCRLHLPCITFRVTEIKGSRAQGQEIYEVKADGLRDLHITTQNKLIQFSSLRPTMQTFLLVRPWDRSLLELPDFLADIQSVDDCTPPPSPLLDSSPVSPAEQESVASEASEREDPDFTDDMQIVEDHLTLPESPIHDSADWSPGEPVDLEFHRALRLIVRLLQPFHVFLLARLRDGEYTRIASDCDIIVKAEDVRDMMNIETLEIL